MDWIKDFLGKYGLVGLLGLVVLILVAQNANLLPGLHEVAGGEKQGPPSPPLATAEQLQRHMDAARQQTEILKDVKSQLEKNHETSSMGFRILCTTQAKTDAQRLECAKIP